MKPLIEVLENINRHETKIFVDLEMYTDNSIKFSIFNKSIQTHDAFTNYIQTRHPEYSVERIELKTRNSRSLQYRLIPVENGGMTTLRIPNNKLSFPQIGDIIKVGKEEFKITFVDESNSIVGFER